jgi:soluble lytic murein transglycosylase
MHVRRVRLLTLAAAAVLIIAVPRAEQRPVSPGVSALTEPLTATAHPPLPRDPLSLWLAPAEPARKPSAAMSGFRAGARLFGEARYAEALPLVSAPLRGSPLAAYALYYRALTELRLSRVDDARRSFDALAARTLEGYLAEAVALRQAELAEAQGDARRAATLYAKVAAGTPLSPEDVLMRLARASLAAGDPGAAATSLARVYYEYPLSDQATLAQAQLDDRQLWQPLEGGNARYRFELGRAERLFGARRYAQARAGFELVAPHASGDDREIAELRLAECDFYLKRYRATRDALEPWIAKASRRAEAQFFYLSSVGEIGGDAEYVRLARELVNAFPTDSWAEETLNNLATHYILADEDDRADGVFREILERFPDGRHGQRAAWKVGWAAYRNGSFDATATHFEAAATRFPRGDHRPAWLYWSGRAREQLGHAAEADARYGLVIADYQNSYYGRLAQKRLADRGRSRRPSAPAAPAAAASTSPSPPLPPTGDVIRQLIAQELYDDAMNELQFAQRTWGDSPAIQATIGLIHSRRGDLRRGINAMKRAYPQYIAEGGEQLPVEMLKVLFPVAYWDLLRKHAAARGLDPYVVAALTAQESTFDAGIRSHANAIGLMQVLPSTGRRYARRLGIKRFSARSLTNPEINARIGTAIFADLVERFGSPQLALASYNAGEGAVARWVAERPGVARDEFVDDIPYPETQNYVKRIMGTAEDYRRVYGVLGATPGAAPKSSVSSVPADRRPARVAKSKSSTRTPRASAGKTSTKPTAKKPTAKKPTKKPSSATKAKTTSMTGSSASRPSPRSRPR